MPAASVVWEDILGDLLMFGQIAVSLFVKNPAHAATAQRIVQAVNTAIPLVQNQISQASGTAASVGANATSPSAA